MNVHVQPFKIGQAVRMLPDIHTRDAGAGLYRILRCNEPDSADPSYVIQSEIDQRQRREPHSRLRAAVSDADLGSRVFVHRTAL